MHIRGKSLITSSALTLTVIANIWWWWWYLRIYSWKKRPASEGISLLYLILPYLWMTVALPLTHSWCVDSCGLLRWLPTMTTFLCTLCHICFQLVVVPSPICCIHVFRGRPGSLHQVFTSSHQISLQWLASRLGVQVRCYPVWLRARTVHGSTRKIDWWLCAVNVVTITGNRQLSMMTKGKENRRMSTGLGHRVVMWHFGFCWQLGCVQHSGATYRTAMKHITTGSRYVQF